MLVESEIYNQTQLTELIQQIGFLPLLYSGIRGFSAEEVVSDDCRYVRFSDGGWDWPLWKWKVPIVTEGGCVYGKFFAGKAGFISREWWPDFCNYRRSQHPAPEAGSIAYISLESFVLGNGSIWNPFLARNSLMVVSLTLNSCAAFDNR